jgi:hypothetical protein
MPSPFASAVRIGATEAFGLGTDHREISDGIGVPRAVVGGPAAVVVDAVAAQFGSTR